MDLGGLEGRSLENNKFQYHMGDPWRVFQVEQGMPGDTYRLSVEFSPRSADTQEYQSNVRIVLGLTNVLVN
jgi:hypothetical protein